METKGDIEDGVRAAGRELYAALRGIPPAFDTRQWMGRLMDRTMEREDFKISLFRFVDVLPSLKTDELVVRLAREYFRDEPGTPSLVRRGLGLFPEHGVAARIAGPLVRRSVASLARRFIAGSEPRELVRALKALSADGAGFTIDLLGEAVVSDKEAGTYAERYLALLDLVHENFPDGAEVSLKVSSFYSQLDPVDWNGSLAGAAAGLRPVLRKAKDLGVGVTLDMEHFHDKNLTIAIFKSLLEEEEFSEKPRLSLALQAYLKDAEGDLKELIGWARERRRTIGVRLVKGAYWDYEVVWNRQRGWPVPVFLQKQETDGNFELLTRMLLENIDVIRPAIATHNLRSLAYAVAAARALGTGREAFEFQMLYGMAEPFRKAVGEQGFPVRVYTPAGELIPGMAYLVRRLLENTSNTSFLRKAFGKGASFEEIIRRAEVPAQKALEEPGGLDGFRNEPLLDFSVETNRKNLAEAISTIKRGMNGTYPLIINGKSVRTSRETASRNPARPGEVVGYVSSASQQECDDAIAEALRASSAWRKTRPAERAEYLFKAAEIMRSRRPQLAALEILEVGKTWKDADGDVAEAIDYLGYYGREMIRLGRPVKAGTTRAKRTSIAMCRKASPRSSLPGTSPSLSPRA